MQNNDKDIIIKFSRDNYIIIKSTRGTMEPKFKASILESVGYGYGNNPLEAALNLVEDLKKTASRIHAAINEERS